MLGLLYQILLGLPVTLGKQVVQAIVEEVNREGLMTEESIKARLQQLQLLLQDGGLNEEDYEILEGQLIERLKTIREAQRSS